ncbi:MAG: XRE family transcriptional regulator [Bacteroidota bacterium]
MRTINPRMITLARDMRGVTQTALAKSIKGLSQGSLSRIEKEGLPMADDVLREVAKYLNFPVDFFFQDQVKTPLSDFYYRKRKSLPKKVLNKLEAKLDVYRMAIDSLLDAVEIPMFDMPVIDLGFNIEPEAIARKSRTFLKVPKGPIINLIEILEKNGVIVQFIDPDTEKFDGITLLTDKGQPVIFVNQKSTNDRKRFTIAHELGHLLMHVRVKYIDLERDEEKEADRFAAEFLMPELDCRNDLTYISFPKLGHLKKYWYVSMKAIIMRATTLKIIDSKQSRNLYIELSRRGYVKKEPFDVPLDNPRLVDEIIEAHRQGLEYTDEELSAMLKLSIEDFRDLFTSSEIPFKVIFKQ